ncbi:DUF2188 domain-containing protein [Microbacterium sp. GCS4]|uniref:DUF2188 domain-containing protein n=1 Tax=Microbacterium sp. GCS4 TaxID=1692239 RepID=UPI00067FCD9B|nr:DUF2188 domain-containing protein [Microbacterium sp. GCS4]KNY05951.1 hypothetical protein AKH00_08935 [Microbacterium sp. GCS4]
MADIRVVRPSPAGRGWEVAHDLARSPAISTYETEADAIGAARSFLAPRGGEIRLCGADGLIERVIRTPPHASAPPAPTPPAPPHPLPHATPAAPPPPPPPPEPSEPLDPAAAVADAATLFDSMRAGARGERLDADGDGEVDGQSIAERALSTGDGSPASSFFRAGSLAITVTLTIVLPLLATTAGMRLEGTAILGDSWWTVFAATLAWSGGIAIAVFVFLSRRTGWTMTRRGLVVAGGFSLSSIIAGLFGGTTLAAPSLSLAEVQRIIIQSPKNRQTLAVAAVALAVYLVWLVALAGLATYGFWGLALGALAGVMVGVQAAHRVRKLSGTTDAVGPP